MRMRSPDGAAVMTTRAPSFRTYVTYRLDLVSRTAREAADEVYRRDCGFDIRQLRVLRTLVEDPDITVSEIVESTMFERTLVSRIITDLVRAGMILRRFCDIDARQTRLSATDAGHAVVARANALGDALNEDLLSVLSPQERRAFDGALKKLTTWRPRDVTSAATDRMPQEATP
jgi:DNA-binding MarR family transcriptional regulator